MPVRQIYIYCFDSDITCAYPNLSANIQENKRDTFFGVKLSSDSKSSKSIMFLEILEALWRRDIKHLIKTRDEHKRRYLSIIYVVVLPIQLSISLSSTLTWFLRDVHQSMASILKNVILKHAPFIVVILPLLAKSTFFRLPCVVELPWHRCDRSGLVSR